MSKYIIKRLLVLIPTLLAIIFIVTGIMSLTPGDPIRIMVPQATPEIYKALSHELGYDKPFINRYGDYVVKLTQGDMGKSFRTGRPVFDEVNKRFPISVKLTIAAILLALMIGVPLGILAAVKQYSIFDIIGTSSSMIIASIPGFWLGLMAVLLFALKLGWLPSNGSETWMSYILPAMTLAFPEAAILLRITRTTMLETIRQDYVRTARAKGQTEKKVIFHHALKNALLPIITVAGMDFGYLLGGAVVIETVFSLNGVGSLIIDSIRMKDAPMVLGCTLFLSFFFMLVMVAVDILYAYIDPRVKSRYQKG